MRLDDVKSDNTVLKDRVRRLEELVQFYAGRSLSTSTSPELGDKSTKKIPLDANEPTQDFLGLGILAGTKVTNGGQKEARLHYKSLTSWDSILRELGELKLAVSDDSFDPAHPNEGEDMQRSIHAAMPFFGSMQQSFRVLYDCLPPRPRMDALLSQYLNSYHAIYPIVHPLAFKRQYQAFLSDPEDAATLSLLFGMMALAIANTDPTDRTSDQYADYALQALQVSEVMTKFTVTTLTALINVIFYYMRERHQQTFTWITLGFALQIARALGLHRDPTHFGITGQKCQTRRHIWTALLVLDAMSAARFGRTTVIDIDEWDTNSPTDLAERSSRITESIPTLFSNAKRQVSLNIAKVFKLLFRPRAHPSYQTILEVEKDVRATHASLPVYAAEDHSVGTKQTAPQHTAAQWFYSRYSQFTLSHTLCVIHRPFLIKKSRDFHHSRIVCLQSARQLANIVFEMQDHLHRNTLSGVQHYAWHVRESCGIAYLPVATILCVGLYIRNHNEFDQLPPDAPVASASDDCILIERIISRLQPGTRPHDVIVQLYDKVQVRNPTETVEPLGSALGFATDTPSLNNITNNLATAGQQDWNHFMSTSGMLGTNAMYPDSHNHSMPLSPGTTGQTGYGSWEPDYLDESIDSKMNVIGNHPTTDHQFQTPYWDLFMLPK